ncbi:uncharacterized protein M6B38_320475 [Iris pallida]|uniref:Uncharacterized protein n=1 Tax=Iris pallida TaxID=29817 RepID=A0AAX6HCB0_IRIPA|nr:uncharacterized protein M6B38_320475 [Iris pallida]
MKRERETGAHIGKHRRTGWRLGKSGPEHGTVPRAEGSGVGSVHFVADAGDARIRSTTALGRSGCRGRARRPTDSGSGFGKRLGFPHPLYVYDGWLCGVGLGVW